MNEISKFNFLKVQIFEFKAIPKNREFFNDNLIEAITFRSIKSLIYYWIEYFINYSQIKIIETLKLVWISQK